MNSITIVYFIYLTIMFFALTNIKKENVTSDIITKIKTKGEENPFIFDRRREDFLEIIGNCKFKLCLDIGCNNSPFLNDIKDNISIYIGIDMNKNILDKNNDRFEKSSKMIHFGLGNAYHLPLKDNSIDLIICTELIEHVPNPENIIKEISRVLKKNGSVILSVPTLPIERILLAYFIEKTGLLKRKLFISEDHLREYTPFNISSNFELISNLFYQLNSNNLTIKDTKSCLTIYNHALFLMDFMYKPNEHPSITNIIKKLDKKLSLLLPEYGQYITIFAEKI